jgi:hypothetical protein
MNDKTKIGLRIAGAVLLIVLAASGWIARRRLAEEHRVREIIRARIGESGPEYSDIPGLVTFPVEDDQWLVLVLDPQAGTVQLPRSAGWWIAAASVGPVSDTLSLYREGEWLLDLTTPGDWE